MKYERLTDKDWHKEKFYGHSDCERTILKRLWNLENKIEQGTLIELPCKVGDTVYMPWQWGGTEGIAILTIERISIAEARPTVRTDFYSDDYAYFDKYNCGVFSFDDFGKTVFLTREEAEKALAERSSENG